MSYIVKTPQQLARMTAYGTDRIYFGGGSGGGQNYRDATAEERRLWGAQAASLEGLNRLSMGDENNPGYLVQGMNNLGAMANESMDGTLANRLRGMAGADASAAMGQGLSGVTQRLERYGSTMNPNALGAQMNNAALQGAAMKSNAMNQANVAAEDTKWNRSAALTGLASGQGAQAINGMGSLAGQIGQNRMQNAQMDAQSQQGLGMMGAYAMGKMFADGGEVHMASGGLTPYKPVNLGGMSPFTFASTDPAPTNGGMMNTVAGLAMPVIGSKMAADAMAKIGFDAPKQAIDGAINATTNALKGIGAGAAPMTVAEGSPMLVNPPSYGPTEGLTQIGSGGVPSIPTVESLTGSASGATLAPEIGAQVVGDVSAGAAAGTTAGGSSVLGALGTAAPWLLGGYAIGKALDIFEDGGKVRRKDMTKGGEVKGPGTTTSDSVPAWLSDDEGVVNARAMKLPHKVTKKIVADWMKSGGDAGDLVLAINNRGLEKRYGKEKAQANPRYEGDLPTGKQYNKSGLVRKGC